MSNNNLLNNINNTPTPKKTLLTDMPESAAKQIVQEAAPKRKKQPDAKNEVRTSYHLSVRVYEEFKRTLKSEGKQIKGTINRLLKEFIARDEYQIRIANQTDDRMGRTLVLDGAVRDKLEILCDNYDLRQYAVIETLMIEYIIAAREKEDTTQIHLF